MNGSARSTRCRDGFTLLEVLVSLALLAGLGVAVLRIQARAVRQCRDAEDRRALVERVEALLNEWSWTGVAVSLPSTGRWDARWSWRREVAPVAVSPGLLATQVRVVVVRHDTPEQATEVYTAAWLVPRDTKSGSRRSAQSPTEASR